MSRDERHTVFSFRWLLDLPIKKKLYLIICLLVGNIVLIISIGTFALNTSSSIRAAVAAEDLWAKAVKTAIYSLGKYALSEDEKAYQDYLEALKIPIAYDRANRELKKSSPDLTVLDQAFLEGGIHPRDIPGVDRLFVHFQAVPHVRTAFRAWAEAQVRVAELQQVARQLSATILARRGNKEELSKYVSQIDGLNRTITDLEIRFSSELGAASRWATDIFLWIMIGGSVFIGLLSVVIAFFISHEIVASISKISEAASRVSRGDLKVRVAVSTRDELGKLADAFNQMAEGLGKLDVLKNEFFANVSHEFRTPLTLMIGPLEDILSSRDPIPFRESLEIVYRNALRLLKLVNSLLDFSRLEAGRLKAHYLPTDLSAFTSELASHFASAVEKAGLDYVVECQPPPQAIYVDRDLWEKIVFNLLSNALKFTFEGGIAIRLGYDELGSVLELSDTGIGIPTSEVPHLFERFHRIQGGRSRTHEGSGIGLSLVNELVRLHGGSVGVESTEGAGTTFTVRLPFGHTHLPKDQMSGGAVSAAVARSANAYVQEASLWLSDGGVNRAPAVAVTESAAAQKPRILVVEDNADMRSYITRLLQPEWEVEVACDGSEALDSIRQQAPDLVLSDIMMPNMNGFELLQRLRKAPQTRHLPILLLSARAGEEAKVEGLTVGADDYLIKPFSARELVARVRTHLNLSRMRVEAAARAAVIERLETERKWLEAALDLEPIPLLLVEPGTARITFANRAADTMAGGTFPKNVSLEDYPKAYKLTDENDHDLSLDEIPSIRAARGEKIEGEIVAWHTPAGRFTVLVNADTLTAMHGHPKTILLAFQDVTTLSKAIRSRDEFLSIASHELRTPITSMRLQLQLARREILPERGIVPSPERLGKLLRIFGLQLDRLTSLVEDLLDVSRVQAGRLSLVPEACNLSELLKQTIERLAPELASAQCPVELDIEDGITGLWDRKRIVRVVTNLLANAAKYAPGRPVRVSLSARGERAILQIRDFGPGIATEKQAKLFDRFERAVSARNVSGLGLGLFISRQIVDAHRGSIELWSEPGKGCLVTVSLPFRRAETIGEGGHANSGMGDATIPLLPMQGFTE